MKTKKKSRNSPSCSVTSWFTFTFESCTSAPKPLSPKPRLFAAMGFVILPVEKVAAWLPDGKLCYTARAADGFFEPCFFFQAEDGIRDGRVTGVQTCALPISPRPRAAG